MPIRVKPVRFYEGRKHRFRAKKVSILGISSSQLYARKQRQRLSRALEIENNPKIAEYLNWIFSIQTKLNLSIPAFAERLGVTEQSVRLWRRRTGHFPSERTYRKLLLLEKETAIPFEFTKIRFGMRIL